MKLIFLVLSFGLGMWNVQAQQKYPALIRSSLEDEIVTISIDKPVYFPGDTVRIRLQRNDSTKNVEITPILIIEEAKLKFKSHNIYSIVIPQACEPGSYRIRLGVLDTKRRRFIFETDCVVYVEEHQIIEQISRYVSIEPIAGGEDEKSAVTLEPNLIRKLRVAFQRDSIRIGMGPQFITIRTTVQLRDGTIQQTLERRVLTFRSDNDLSRDRAMLVQYRRAYGAYAAIRSEEFAEVQINVNSTPDWAIIKIEVEPDYSIKIGGYDKSNSYIRYFRVKGPKIEMGFSIGIPKVLFDTQANDSLDYGNSSAMIRFYYVDESSGNRFPINMGVGTFGVNTPVDVNVGRGGFALSLFLDVAAMMRILEIYFIKKITVGLELAPLFPVKKKVRLLLVAHVGITF